MRQGWLGRVHEERFTRAVREFQVVIAKLSLVGKRASEQIVGTYPKLIDDVTSKS